MICAIFLIMAKKKKQYQTRLDPDVAKQVDRYAEDRGLSKSEAIRRLTEAGLEAGSGPSNNEIRDDLEDVKLTLRSIEDGIKADPAEDVTRRADSAGLVPIGILIGLGFVVLAILEVGL